MTESFLVLSCEQRTTGAGKPFLKMQVKFNDNNKDHPREEMPGMVWGESISEYIPKPGEVISCVFKMGEFKGSPQITVEKYCLHTSQDTRLFRDPPAIDVDATYLRLYVETDWRSGDMNRFFGSLYEVMGASSPWLGYSLADVLKNIPGGERNHHARRGGLLQHIEEMYDLGVTLLQEGPPDLMEPVDRDVLLAAILLHDLGKIYEYHPETLKYYSTRVGQYVGHPAWGTLTVERYWNPTGDQHLKMRLMHAVISHHGKEHSEVSPLTPEAILLHEIDGISAHLDAWRQGLEKKESPEYSKMLGGKPITPYHPEV